MAKLRFFLPVLALLGAQASFARPVERIALKSAFVAHRDFVTIADLLPADAPKEMRARTEAIQLGEAPMAGVHRTFGRAQVWAALTATPDLRASFEIPDAIEVTRWARPLTRDDVFGPIRTALESNHFSGSASLGAADIRLLATVIVTEEAPKLTVTRIEPDPQGGTRLRLWAASEPRNPPFWVHLAREIGAPSNEQVPDSQKTVPQKADQVSDARKTDAQAPNLQVTAPQGTNPQKTDPQVDEAPVASQKPRGASVVRAEFTTAATPRAAQREKVQQSKPGAAVLVKTGQAVQLVVQTAGMQLTTTAISLTSGKEGDYVRVHSTLSSRTVEAKVVNSQLVEVDY